MGKKKTSFYRISNLYFNHQQVENIDLRNGPSTHGAAYPISKMIFIGAKETHKNNEQKIKGVIIHELGHYAMNLVYENKENPYYENEKDAEKNFQDISEQIYDIIWPFDEDNEEDSDDKDSDLVDKCDGIISSVFTAYNPSDYHPELIVRPFQILAQYQEDENKLKRLQNKYECLFSYVENKVLKDIEKFDLRNRKEVANINEAAKVLTQKKSVEIVFAESKKIEISNIIFENQFNIINTNIQQLLLYNVYQQICTRKQIELNTIFVNLRDKKDDFIIKKINENLDRNKDLVIVFNCSNDFYESIEKDLKIILEYKVKYMFITKSENCSQKLKKIINDTLNIDLSVDNINYVFDDLEEVTQQLLLQTKIKFQKTRDNVYLQDLMLNYEDENEEISKLKSEICNDLLNDLVEANPIVIDHQTNDEFSENFEILFQQRKLVKKYTSNNNAKPDQLISQEELLAATKRLNKILISDAGGTGKSWIMQKMTLESRKVYSNKWVSYVDLKLYSSAFKNCLLDQDVTSFLTNSILKLEKSIDKKMFNYLYERGNVIILFDGFDELSEECQQNLKRLITLFKNKNQIWLATRDYFEEDLRFEINLDVVCSLEKFSEQDGMELIVTSWLINDKDVKDSGNDFKLKMQNDKNYKIYEDYVKNLNDKIPHRLIGFPLFYNIIAIAFANKKEMIKISSAYEIFEEYVYQQRDRMVFEKGEKGKNSLRNIETKEFTYLAVHQRIALKSLFPDSKYSEEIIDWSNKELSASGLILIRNGEHLFQHESLREFFIAQFIFETLKKGIKRNAHLNEDFKLIFKAVMTNYKFYSIRKMLNEVINKNELLRPLEEFIMDSKNEDIIFKIFNEGLDNMILILLKFQKDSKNYNIINRNIQKTIESIVENIRDPKIVVKIFGYILDYLNIEDIKSIFQRQELLGCLAEYRCDVEVLEYLAETLKKMINKEYVTDIFGNKIYYDRNIFYFLCKSEFSSTEKIKGIFELFKNYFKDHEIVELVKSCDATGKNILQTSIEMGNDSNFKIMCTVVKEFWKHLDSSFNFKDLVMQKPLQDESNIFHLVAYCNNLSIYYTLWDLIVEEITNMDELINFLNQPNDNGDSFLHILIKLDKSKLLEVSLQKMNYHFDKERMEILLKKENLFHTALKYSKNHEIHNVLWTFIERLCRQNAIFKSLFKSVDEKGNNILHYAVMFSSNEYFNLVLKTLKKIISHEEIATMLEASNNDNQCIIILAALHNKSIDLQQFLWKILPDYLSSSQMKDMIKSIDSESINSVVMYNDRNIVEFAWNEIKKYIDTRFKQEDYVMMVLSEKLKTGTFDIASSSWYKDLLEEETNFLENIKEKERTRDEQLRTSGIWVPWKATNSGVPQHAVIGADDFGLKSYVIRAKHYHKGTYRGIVPGKYCISSGRAYIPYYDKEHEKTDFEIFTHTNYYWGPFSEEYSIVAEMSSNGNIYVARRTIHGHGVIGKLDRETYYFPYEGKEIWFHDGCEVLNRYP